MKNYIEQTVSQLNTLIETNQVTTPVFTRFRIEERFQILPVNGITIAEKHCIVQVDQFDEMSFSWDDLIEVVVFQDTNGVAIFLDDISPKKGITQAEMEINQRNSDRENARIIARQDEWYNIIDKLNNGVKVDISIFEPRIYHLFDQRKVASEFPENIEFPEHLFAA